MRRVGADLVLLRPCGVGVEAVAVILHRRRGT